VRKTDRLIDWDLTALSTQIRVQRASKTSMLQ